MTGSVPAAPARVRPESCVDSPALQVSGVSKRFGGVQALRSIDLEVGRGELRALVGENGSGKSTLVKILSGYHSPEHGGTVRVGGHELVAGKPDSAYRLGCRFVHQDLGLIDSLSIRDNLCLTSGYPSRFGTVRPKECRRLAVADIARFGVEVDPAVEVGTLTATERTCVAISRAMHADEAAPAVLLVLDEPTATLPEREVNRLLDLLRRVADSGVGVLYISHRLGEIFRLADTVTVLRDGREVATEATAALGRSELINLITGSGAEEAMPPVVRTHRRDEPPVLRLQGLASEGLDAVSIEAGAGDVIGIAGAAGSAREFLLPTVFGGRPREAGVVSVNGKEIPQGRPDLAIAAGVAYLPPDRKLLAGMMGMTARENLTLPSLKPFFRRLRLRRRGETAETRDWFGRLDIRPAEAVDAPLESFSGGNQQKILLAKWLRLHPTVLLVDEPTQGVDVSARLAVHRYLAETAASGATLMISSSEAEELVTICSRVLVFRDAKLVAELVGSEISLQSIGRHSYGTATEMAT